MSRQTAKTNKNYFELRAAPKNIEIQHCEGMRRANFADFRSS